MFTITRPSSLLPLCLGLILAAGCSDQEAADHAHDKGDNGGLIVSVGHDHYHVEAIFAEAGAIKLFTLDQDQTQVLPVRSQEITAYLRAPGRPDSATVVLKPQPQPGDAAGTTSLFVGQLPESLWGSPLIVTVPSIQIGKGRYRFGFMTEGVEAAPQMPTKVRDDEERQLYLTAGGAYLAADISANGSQTASQRYQGFKAAHDMHPQAGDRLCPITGTKANRDCTWIVAGKKYEFCCPPCIDEFVERAKEQPERIASPDSYVKK
jgi:hypothetical protein